MAESSTQQPVTTTVEHIYAAALVDMAAEADVLADVADEMRQIGELLEQQPDLRALLFSRVLSAAERAEVIDRIFQSRVSDLVRRFLQVLSAKGRANTLPGVVRAVHEIVAARQGVIEIDAYVPSTMDGSLAGQVATRIGQRLQRQVVLHQHEDKSLVGGLKLRVHDRLIDGSVAAQLRVLRQRMITAGREKARAAAGQGEV